MASIQHTLKRPLILTEKGAKMRESENKYLFEVAQSATKYQIRAAVETAFNVKVIDIHTMIVRGRLRRMGRGHSLTPNWKKAIVTLREGDKIEAFEAT
jgi:large subunit ribosomal protein L23